MYTFVLFSVTERLQKMHIKRNRKSPVLFYLLGAINSKASRHVLSYVTKHKKANVALEGKYQLSLSRSLFAQASFCSALLITSANLRTFKRNVGGNSSFISSVLICATCGTRRRTSTSLQPILNHLPLPQPFPSGLQLLPSSCVCGELTVLSKN